MNEGDENADRGASNVERMTDSNNVQPDPEIADQRRLTNTQAVFILFTVAMLPAYVQPAQLDLQNKKCT